jgi:hypothetical protein
LQKLKLYIQIVANTQLEKAEAEAVALRRELEIRKKTNSLDLSNLTPTSFNRVDGTGFRETLFQGPGGKGTKKQMHF